MTASEQISMGLDSHDHGRTNLVNVHTLIRILCHKKDREASKFLKRQYQLPMSSGISFSSLFHFITWSLSLYSSTLALYKWISFNICYTLIFYLVWWRVGSLELHLQNDKGRYVPANNI